MNFQDNDLAAVDVRLVGDQLMEHRRAFQLSVNGFDCVNLLSLWLPDGTVANYAAKLRALSSGLSSPPACRLTGSAFE